MDCTGLVQKVAFKGVLHSEKPANVYYAWGWRNSKMVRPSLNWNFCTLSVKYHGKGYALT